MHPKPKKRLSQVFLIDKNIQKKIATACCLSGDDVVLEIGPGRGEVSALLLEKVKKLIAVEIDPDLCQILRQCFSKSAAFKLINKDILKLNLSRYASQLFKGKEKKLKIVGNLPYHIASPIIIYLLRHSKAIKEIYIMVQKELAMRLVSGPGSKDYSSLTCLVQYHAKPRILFTIKKSSFLPKPKVDSCFMRIDLLARPPVDVHNEKLFFVMIRAAFNQRRKALRNSLARLFPQLKLIKALNNLKLNPNSRPENLSLKDLNRLLCSLQRQ